MSKNLMQSTGLANYVQITGARRAALNGGTMRFYSGTVPATADAALSGNTKLAELTTDGAAFSAGVNGLTFENAVSDGVVNKTPAETWSTSSCNASGTATFFRWEMNGDTQGLSTTQIRMQGVVGNAGCDVNLQNTTFTASAPFTLQSFSIRQPKARSDL